MLTRVRLVGAVLAMIGACATGAAQWTNETDLGTKSVTLSRIVAAWKAREERVKSFHVSWDARLILPKGFPRPFEPLLAGLETQNNGSNGDRVDYTLPQSELWGEGPNRLRDDFLMVRNTNENAWERIARVRNVVDGASHSRLIVPFISGDCEMTTIWHQFEATRSGAGAARALLAPFQGAFGESAPHWKAREVDLLPLLLAFRPSNPLSAIASLPWRVVSENAIFEQVHCVKLQAIPSSDDNRPQRFARFNSPAYNSDTCWVDPSRDYVVVFWESKRPDRPDVSVAIDYRHDPTHGWLPSGWHRRLSPRRPRLSSGTVDATVTHCTINEALPAETFARDFPASTQVCDVTVDEQVGAKLARESASPIPKRDATRDAIVTAWTRQQSKIRSYQIAWESQWIRPYREMPDVGPANGKIAKKPVLHPAFQRFKSRNRHWLDGDRFAVEQLLIEPTPAPITRIVKRTFDGQTSRELLTTDFSATATCRIEPGFPEFYAQGADVEPVLLAFRPMEPRLGRIDPAKFRVLPYQGKVDGISCTILGSGEPDSGQMFYWLDPDRDYIVLREHRMADGRDYSLMEISYRADPKFGWIPSGWKKAVVGERGTFDDLVTSKVTELAINETLPESAFRIVFPKGAKISDISNQRRVNAGPRIPKPAIRKPG